MIHDHAELELAAAAIDFELTPAERARLEKAMAECSVCARAAAAYRRQANLLVALPVVDASPAVRRQVERAVGVRAQRTPWTWALLAAALLGLLLTSVLVAGAIDQYRRNGLVDVAPTPSPSEAPLPSVQPSGLEPDVIALDPPSGELADVGPPLPHESMAAVVTTNLRIRSAPFVGDASVRYQPFLQPDDRLFVVDGPVIGQNYEWYQVKAWRPGEPARSWPVGWVARAGHDGEVWFRPASTRCPDAPIDLPALLALAPMERVACYHDAPIEVRAVVAESSSLACDPARLGCPTGPALLTGGTLVATMSTAPTGAADGLSFAVDPAANVTGADLAGAGVVRLRGAFDHPDASSCRPDPARAGPDGPLSPVDALLACRSRFIVTNASIEPFPRRSNTPAVTVSDRLRVRSLPEVSQASIKYDPLLPIGTRLFVLDGPALGDGYAWYEVLVPIPSASGSTVGRWLTGWVAAAGKDGEPWIEDASIDCPASNGPLSLADLAQIRQRPVDDGPLACFGTAEVQIDGQARLHCADAAPVGDAETAWLSARSGRWLEIIVGDRRLEARIDPTQPIDLACDRQLRSRYRIVGHFDDPAAARCTSGPASTPGSTDLRVAVYRCRTFLVATSVEPLARTASPEAPRSGG
jgi:hypothetical protein